MPRCSLVLLKSLLLKARSWKPLCALIVLVTLSGCAALSPYSRVTKLELTLAASERMNPDLNGRPSPMVVRLFELKHPVAFETADFFSLYERARESLAPDLVATEELELRPGETLELKLRVEEGSRYVGVLAAYRDLLDTQWRYTLPVDAQAINRAGLVLDQNGIRNTHESSAKADQ